MERTAGPGGLLVVRTNRDKGDDGALDAKVEPIASGDARLPDIVFASALVGAQGGVMGILRQDNQLSVDLSAQLDR
jgi:hypothetical protein